MIRVQKMAVAVNNAPDQLFMFRHSRITVYREADV